MEKVITKRKKKIEMQPQAEMLKEHKEEKKLIIGIPKEKIDEEKRIALTPLAVSLLANQGHKILIESGAGLGSNYTDEEYKIAGAEITKNKKEIFQSTVVIKIAPFEKADIDMLGNDQTIISALHSFTQSRENIVKLINKNTNAIAFENIKDSKNFHPLVHLMSEIAGSTSVMIAAELMSNVSGGKGVLLGGLAGISPAEVIIIGAGTASNSAVKIAKELGATVKIFDDNINELIEAQNNFGKNIFTSTITNKVLLKALESADVVINTMRKDFNKDYIITEDMVEMMKKDSVIIDLQVESGSVIETSKLTTYQKPFYTAHEVIHYCIPNIASRVARTASIAISNVLTPIVAKIIEYHGILPVIKEDISVRNGTYLLKGILTNWNLGNKLDLDSRDINLLMAAF